MNAAAFRHLYDYHFAQNRTIWETYVIPLSQDQFTPGVAYSHGSVRDHVPGLRVLRLRPPGVVNRGGLGPASAHFVQGCYRPGESSRRPKLALHRLAGSGRFAGGSKIDHVARLDQETATASAATGALAGPPDDSRSVAGHL